MISVLVVLLMYVAVEMLLNKTIMQRTANAATIKSSKSLDCQANEKGAHHLKLKKLKIKMFSFLCKIATDWKFSPQTL